MICYLSRYTFDGCTGTYTLQKVFISETCDQLNCLELNVSYSEIQPAYSGVLVILVPQGEEIAKLLYFPLVRQMSRIVDQFFITPIALGNYNVLLYKISETGFIIPGQPILSTSGNVSKGKFGITLHLQFLFLPPSHMVI